MTRENDRNVDYSCTNLIDRPCFKEPMKSYDELVGKNHERVQIGNDSRDFRSFIADIHDDIISELHKILREKLNS
ncbi:MAG: hypothetical protein ACTSUE_27375 [Promethearchaeota archaeon]